MLTTPLCKLLGVRYPIIQAGMGLIATGKLAGEVSRAGGLGVIGAGYMTADELRSEIRIARTLTARPFGVDILFGKPQVIDAETTAYAKNVQAQIDVCLNERIPVLISGLGNPAGFVDEAHRRGIFVMSVVGTVQQAITLAHAGVDAIIASGSEGGGHVGTIATATLVPAVVDAVTIPVVAGGGLVDGRGLVAALAFGAQGVWMGTRFIATFEAHAHPNYGKQIAAIGVDGTVVTRCHSGKPCRLIDNNFTRSWRGRENEIEPFPLQLQHVGAAAAHQGRLLGDIDNGSLPAGQGAGLIHSVKSAADVIADTIAEARTILERLSSTSK